jgi:hypothetical protein
MPTVQEFSSPIIMGSWFSKTASRWKKGGIKGALRQTGRNLKKRGTFFGVEEINPVAVDKAAQARFVKQQVALANVPAGIAIPDPTAPAKPNPLAMITSNPGRAVMIAGVGALVLVLVMKKRKHGKRRGRK